MLRWLNETIILCFLAKAVKGKGSRVSKSDMKDKSRTKSVKALEERDKMSAYQEAIDLMRECARLLYIRWLQVNLIKELIDVIYK